MSKLREQIDALCHENRIKWDKATKEAKAREDEIRALEAKLENEAPK
jgi:hypothetical protein